MEFTSPISIFCAKKAKLIAAQAEREAQVELARAEAQAIQLKSVEIAKALGFTGKASISPRHVEVINSVFSPTQADVDYAYEVMEAIELAKQQGKGAISLHGKMIDAPIVARAQQTIAMAQALGMERGN